MIRNAKKDDKKVLLGLSEFILSLELDIMEQLSNEKLLEILTYCFESEFDRFSYKNCKVYEEGNSILGFSFSYHYDELETMKNFWFDNAVKNFNLNEGTIIFDYNEMLEGEYYLDTLYVFSESRGKGVGNKFLTQFSKEDYDVKSLNVAESNLGARKLYESYGFKKEGSIYIGHEDYDHMVLRK